MFDWNGEEFRAQKGLDFSPMSGCRLTGLPLFKLGNILWGETREADDHIVPYPKGNEVKPLLTFGDPTKKQYTQETRPVKITDQKISGSNSLFSFSKPESGSECNKKQAVSSPGAEIDSWPDSPLTNVVCDGKYAGRNDQDSINMQTSDFGTEIPNYDPTKGHAPGLFGNECEDKEHGDFLEYSWDNIGSFDDLDSMFRNDDPIFGQDIGNGELWLSSADLFSSPTKSFPTCSPSSGLNDLCMPEHEMKLDYVQHEDPSRIHAFGKHLPSYDLKEIDLRKNRDYRKDCPYSADSAVNCVGGKSKTLLEEKANPKMIETSDDWKIDSTGKVNGKRKLLKCPTKEEKESSSLNLHASRPLTANQFQSFGNQLATSSVQSIQFSVSRQKQPIGPESLSYWQTSHPFLSADSNLQQYPMISTLPNAHSETEKNQHVHLNHGNSPHVNPVFPAPSRPPVMSPQEKLEKLKRRQQLQAMLAIQEQQQQFGQKSPRENGDIEGSTIEIEENLKPRLFMGLNTPIEHGDSNTAPMLSDDCSLQERVLEKLQDVIGKLDTKVRLCIRDSLFRLAQSAMQRHNNIDTSSANNNMQCDGVAENDESYGPSRRPRIPEVETDTNPIDRIMAHLLFQPQESSTKSVKDCEIPASPSYAKFVREPNTEGIKNSSVGCLSDYSIDKQSSSQASCAMSKTKDVEHFQRLIYINTPEKPSKSEPEAHGQ